ncbi:MAG: hypothetical protein ABIJ37_08705 [Pseudomonadota bacterium]
MKRFSQFFLISLLLVGVVMLFSMPKISSASDMDTAKKLFEERADLDKAKQGVDLFQKIIDKDPKNFEARELQARLIIWLAMALGMQPDGMMEAVEYLSLASEVTDNWLKVQPDAVAPNFWRGYAAAASKDVNSFNLYMSKAIKIDPNYFGGMPMTLMGYLKGMLPPFMGGDKVEAYKLIDQALEASPDDINIHRIKATILLADIKDMAKKAIVHLQFAIDSPKKVGQEPEQERDKVEAKKMMDADGEALKALAK